MTHVKSLLRPGTTAIAAVLALSASPLLAQVAGQPGDAAPVKAAPPIAAPISVTPPAATVAAPGTVPNPAGLNIPQIKVDIDTPATETPATATSSAAPTPRAEAPPARTPKAALTAPLAINSGAPTIAATPAAATPAAPVERTASAPIAAVPAMVVQPMGDPAPVDARPAQVANDPDVLPIAGAGAFALALLGGGFAITRRKRRAADDERIKTADPLAPQPMTPDAACADYNRSATIAAAATTVTASFSSPAAERLNNADTAAIDAPATAVPAGFDLSRYGPHVQAAYRGPTADNPSLSLRKRLARARFFDQRARTAAHPATAQAAARAATTMDRMQPAATPQQRSEPIASRSSGWTRPALRPAFQS